MHQKTPKKLFIPVLKTEHRIKFMKEKKKVFHKALSSCLSSVIRMGLGLTQGNLQDHVSLISKRMVCLSGYLPSIFSCYHYFAYEARNCALNFISSSWTTFFNLFSQTFSAWYHLMVCYIAYEGVMRAGGVRCHNFLGGAVPIRIKGF